MTDTPVKCLIVSSSVRFYSAAKKLAEEELRCETALAATVRDGRGMLLTGGYTLVLINAPLPDDMGVSFAMEACTESDAGVLLLIKSELYEETYYKVLPAGVITLPKPTSTQMVAQSLRVLCAIRERLRGMRQHQATVEEKIEELRLVNRAKWLLIECLHMTEPDAHRYITRQAMEQRTGKREIAENIIRTYQ